MTDEEKLRKLNEDTFVAEAKNPIDGEDWDKFLWRVLADDYRIKRANPAILPQDKRRMIVHIQYDENPAERLVTDTQVFVDGGYGVVTCTVTLTGQRDTFHNIKVFTRQLSKDWQCVYWRVSKVTEQ